jgi:hypothetical protein
MRIVINSMTVTIRLKGVKIRKDPIQFGINSSLSTSKLKIKTLFPLSLSSFSTLIELITILS